MLKLVSYRGEQLARHFAELAQLRIRVFREFPYLYDGDLDYEERYLRTYSESADSIVILAIDGKCIVGASTAIPLMHETDEVKAPFLQAGYIIEEIFYFGESVLLPEYRGRGVGVGFFEQREAEARRSATYRSCCFCAVQRPEDHPRRPTGYEPLNRFWKNRGFEHCPELVAQFSWKDLDEKLETTKNMVFWKKQLL